jgi:glycosyltransferase involved in cell wall biosynthesis
MQKCLLRIGVDARLLSEPITGLGRYLFEVLSRMVGEGHEWYLYSHRPIIIGDWKRENIFLKNMNLNNRPMRMLWAQTILPYWALKDQVDIFWSPAHRIPRYLSSRIASVVTIHDLVWRYAGETMRPLSRWLDSKFMMEAARKANIIITVSNSTAEDLIVEDKKLAAKIIVISLGVSSDLLTSLISEKHRTATILSPYYLFVGTLEPRKNLERLIDAISILPANVKNLAKLLIVGGKGWGGVNIQEIIKQYGVEDNVVSIGYVDDSTLAELYSNALFLVMPSLYEGFGLPLIEAMAHGVPSLTSNRSSMPEVIGDAGILIDPYDVESISAGLSLLLTDHNLRYCLSDIALRRVTQFDWRLSSKRTLKVFKKLVNSSTKCNFD